MNKETVVGVIGLGYVGLPLVVEVAGAGLRVIGFDVDQAKVGSLKEGISYIEDISNEQVGQILGKFEPTTDFSRLRDVNFIIIAVPTPLRKTKDPDLSYILSAVTEIEKYITPPCAVVLESTTYPGTTNELITKRFADNGLVVGKDVFIAFSPERVDPGNKTWKTKNTPKIIGCVTEKCKEVIVGTYSKFIDTVIPVDSPEEAEMVKLLENTYRAVNIALVNELLMMSNRMGINFWNVIRGAATKPFGFQAFAPGPGIGGHCIPLDPQYLSWRAKSFSFYNRFIELASDINENMPGFVVSKAMRILNEQKKPLSTSKVLLLGLSYKKDVSDIRESPAIAIAKQLKDLGASVYGCDPFVTPDVIDSVLNIMPVEINHIKKEDYDLTVLVTNHSLFNTAWLTDHSTVLFDTRGVFPKEAPPSLYLL